MCVCVRYAVVIACTYYTPYGKSIYGIHWECKIVALSVKPFPCDLSFLWVIYASLFFNGPRRFFYCFHVPTGISLSIHLSLSPYVFNWCYVFNVYVFIKKNIPVIAPFDVSSLFTHDRGLGLNLGPGMCLWILDKLTC